MHTILLLLAFCAVALPAAAQSEAPTINPMAHIQTDDGEEEAVSYQGNAPLTVRFTAGAEHVGGYTAHYEWRFTLDDAQEPYLVRHEEDTEYEFTKAGTHRVALWATFTLGTDTVAYTAEYWQEAEPISITIAESKLEFPNAFSPNGDGINDVYKAKDGWQSIVEFDAAIVNRWGQVLYRWTDPADGWDGTYHGRPVKQGVYFVVVKAQGADGLRYNIKRDVNLLRGFTEESVRE